MIETKFKNTELGQIPENWEVYTLGKIGEPRMCKRIMKKQTNEYSGIPFYKIGTFGRKADAFISPELWKFMSETYNYPRKGDVLISAAGTIGRTVVFDGTPSYFQDSNIVWIDNNQQIVVNQLLAYLYSITQWSTDASTISRLYNSNLRSTLIAVPTEISEQERIAEALSDVDELISELDALIAKKRVVFQGTMQDLMTAKRRLPGFTEPWNTNPLSNYFEFGNGYTPSKSCDSYWKGGTIPWFRMEDIRQNGRILSDSIQHITPLGVKGELFPAGSFIVSTTATIGEHAWLIADSLANQQFTFLTKGKSLKPILSEFFFYKLYEIGDWCRANVSTNTLMAVNIREFKEYPLYAPSDIQEQQAIADILSDMDAEIAELDAKRDKYLAVRQGMMQQLLTGKIRLI